MKDPCESIATKKVYFTKSINLSLIREMYVCELDKRKNVYVYDWLGIKSNPRGTTFWKHFG